MSICLNIILPDELIKILLLYFLPALVVLVLVAFYSWQLNRNFISFDVLFEVVSAGTVGLSRELLLNFHLRRVNFNYLNVYRSSGLLTMIYLIMQPHSSKIKYPKEYIQIG